MPAIEESLASGSGIVGYSLDLIKAYNPFGRYVVARILHRLGIPKTFVDAWVSSLDKMVRYATIQICVANGILATTGVPEGCSISFMVSSKVNVSDPLPFAYADTWSWIVTEQREHVMAYQRTLRLTDSMKLTIDHSKSWHWSSKKPTGICSRLLGFPAVTLNPMSSLLSKTLVR